MLANDVGILFPDRLVGDAAVFLDFAWSRQAQRGKRVFEEWSSRGRRPATSLVVTPDDDEAVARWVMEECRRTHLPLHGGGHGTLLWVRRGRVVGWIEKLFLVDADEVEEQYKRVFSDP